MAHIAGPLGECAGAGGQRPPLRSYKEALPMYGRRKRINWAFASLATVTVATSLPFIAFVILAGFY